MNEQTLTARWRSWAPQLRSVMRIAAAFLFMQYGTGKLFAFPHALLPNGGTVPIASLLGVAGLFEVIGGTLMLVGLFARPVAFVLAGEMAVAYFKAHAPMGFWPLFNNGLPAVFFCFVWLYLSAAGPGPWSIDALRRHPGNAG